MVSKFANLIKKEYNKVCFNKYEKMTVEKGEKPIEYKNRIDREWNENRMNMDKLIEKIEKYELVDEKYKARIKQELLKNFDKNEKVCKREERYMGICKILEEMDKGRENLVKMEKELEKKKQEESIITEEYNRSVDAKDKTTLDMQKAKKDELFGRWQKLKLEIDQLEKDIEEKKKEIEAKEKIYGKNEEKNTENKVLVQEKKENRGTDFGDENKKKKLSVLKTYQEETIKELWKINRNMKEIIRLLGEGTWVDENIKERIQQEIKNKFYDYYSEKQGILSMKVARFMKNKLKRRRKEIDRMPDGKEKEEEIAKLEEKEDIYYGWSKKLFELRDKLKLDFVEIEKIKKIGGKPIYKLKKSDGYFCIVRGDTLCGDSYKKIVGEIKEIGEKPVFVGMDGDDYYSVFRGERRCGDSCKKIVGEIKEIGKKPVFVGVDILNDDCCVFRGETLCGGFYEKIVGEIREIGEKPVFVGVDWGDDYNVYRGNERCGTYYEEISKINEIGEKPAFIGRSSVGNMRDVIILGYGSVLTIEEHYEKDGKFKEVLDVKGTGIYDTPKALVEDRWGKKFWIGGGRVDEVK